MIILLIYTIVYYVLENMSYHEFLKVVLDKTPPIYVPGETINGKVILNPTATITIRGAVRNINFLLILLICMTVRMCMCVNINTIWQ